MTIFRTVRISEDQLPKFEKMMEENGFDIVSDQTPEIPEDVQDEMVKRSRNWTSEKAISAEEVKVRLKIKA